LFKFAALSARLKKNWLVALFGSVPHWRIGRDLDRLIVSKRKTAALQYEPANQPVKERVIERAFLGVIQEIAHRQRRGLRQQLDVDISHVGAHSHRLGR
jgi:hypothetical protein